MLNSYYYVVTALRCLITLNIKIIYKKKSTLRKHFYKVVFKILFTNKNFFFSKFFMNISLYVNVFIIN